MRIFIIKFIRKILFSIILYLKKRNPFLKKIVNILTRKKYQAFKFENINDYILSQPQKVQYIYNNLISLFYYEPQYYSINEGKNELTEVKGTNTYAAIFEQAAVIGGSNLILLENNRVIYDIKHYNTDNNFFYSDQGMPYYNGEHCLVAINKSNISYDKGIFLGGNFSWNYYHYLYEILVKFEQIEKSNLDINIPFLVDKICVDIPQYFELLSFLNYKDRKIIPLDKGVIYPVKQLFYFSCPNIIPPDFINIKLIKPSDILFDLKTLEYLREYLLPKSSDKLFPKKIFISRKKASGRRSFNEDEVFEVLSKYNFEIVFPEDYSISDQIAMFNNAEYIVGGSGAAFTNLLFCNNNCKVLAFMKNIISFSGFSTVAKYTGADLIYFTEAQNKNENIKNVHKHYVININKLKLFISEWIK